MKGEVFFNTLSYFLSCEDLARRDANEGTNIYKPPDGLEVTNVTTNQKFKDHRGLISRIKHPERVFVFCTSLELSDNLFKKFSASGCAEISDVKELSNRISRHLRRSAHKIKNKEILSGRVEYYNFGDKPEARYACPDQIIMSKSENFSDEKEYRIAFAKDANAFEVNNVDYYLSNSLTSYIKIGKPKKLSLGDLTDIAKFVM